MKGRFIDYRGNSLAASQDIRKRLKLANSGQTINIVCKEEQVIKLLREITYYDGVIVNRDTTDKGVFITIRKA